jgi:hypothetical protein
LFVPTESSVLLLNAETPAAIAVAPGRKVLSRGSRVSVSRGIDGSVHGTLAPDFQHRKHKVTTQ